MTKRYLIKPVAEFRKTVASAEALAKDGKIVTFGIVPDKPETGYGYIKTADKISGNAYAVEAFKEKPDEQTAAEYIKAGCYYWNSGMFMFSLKTMEAELKAHASGIYAAYSGGYQAMLADFEKLPDISIDYAIAE